MPQMLPIEFNSYWTWSISKWWPRIQAFGFNRTGLARVTEAEVFIHQVRCSFSQCAASVLLFLEEQARNNLSLGSYWPLNSVTSCGCSEWACACKRERERESLNVCMRLCACLLPTHSLFSCSAAGRLLPWKHNVFLSVESGKKCSFIYLFV